MVLSCLSYKFFGKPADKQTAPISLLMQQEETNSQNATNASSAPDSDGESSHGSVMAVVRLSIGMNQCIVSIRCIIIL